MVIIAHMVALSLVIVGVVVDPHVVVPVPFLRLVVAVVVIDSYGSVVVVVVFVRHVHFDVDSVTDVVGSHVVGILGLGLGV